MRNEEWAEYAEDRRLRLAEEVARAEAAEDEVARLRRSLEWIGRRDSMGPHTLDEAQREATLALIWGTEESEKKV